MWEFSALSSKKDIEQNRLTKQEEFDLLRVKTEENQNKIILHNAYIVTYFLSQYAKYHLEDKSTGVAEELMQEGFIALIKAYHAYDVDNAFYINEETGQRERTYFTTFASRSVKRAIFDHMFSLGRSISVPETRGVRKAVIKCSREQNPDLSEFSTWAQRFAHGYLSQVSLNSKLPGDQSYSPSSEYIDNIESRAPTVFEEVSKEQLIKKIRHVIGTDFFNEKEKFIVQNALSEDKLTLVEIGEKFGFSHQRAQQIQKKAIKKLRSYLVV